MFTAAAFVLALLSLAASALVLFNGTPLSKHEELRQIAERDARVLADNLDYQAARVDGLVARANMAVAPVDVQALQREIQFLKTGMVRLLKNPTKASRDYNLAMKAFSKKFTQQGERARAAARG